MHGPSRSPTTTVCLARHGETDWNAEGILQGWLDVPINDIGRRQAHELTQTLATANFTAIHTSPLARARETAEIVAAGLGLAPPASHAGLKERNFGAIQGIPKTELADLNPVIYQQILKRNPACDFEQGETMDEFAGRVLEAVMQIAARHVGERLLVVTHGWVMDVVTRHIRGLPRHAILPVKRKNMECLWLAATQQSIAALPDSLAPRGHEGAHHSPT